MNKQRVLLSLGACIALGSIALGQAPAAGSSPQPSGIAGGATGSGASGISGTTSRFNGPRDPIMERRAADLHKVLDKVTPVTDAQLHNPSPNDWLMWRRTYDAFGFSPLKQINRENVKNLNLAWSWGLSANGVYEYTPVVHDGIMYVWSHGDVAPNLGENIQALDARNGNLLWKYHRAIRPGFNPLNVFAAKRSLAIGGDKLVFPTTDMHIVALDLKTGKVDWDVATDDDNNPKGVRTYNGAPLIVNNKVIMGSSGCAAGGMTFSQTCFVAARELETGKELWRFNTFAQPGEPGDETWNGLPAEKRWGGSVWSIPSYDPELNLLYVGVGTPYPWRSIERGTHNPKGGGHNGDGLYMNSTLAINPDTGKLVWYYQHQPNDDWDQDYAYERIITNSSYGGKTRKVLITVGKPGVFEVLDAKTGEFVGALDPGFQNIFSMDMKTGVKTPTLPSETPWTGGAKHCATANGARNYMPGAYDPETKQYYLAIDDLCMNRTPETPDHLIAFDANTMKASFNNLTREVQSSGILTTAGGLLFSGASDRYFRALDVKDGKELWRSRQQDVACSAPLTYMVDGKQYVSIIAGNPGNACVGRARATQEFQRPDESVVLWTYQLP